MRVEEILLENQDIKYRDFSSSLILTVDKNKVIGVRTPVIRKIEKELSLEDKQEFIRKLPHKYLEENTLHGLCIESLSKNIDEAFEYLDEFLPYVDNWATCDVMSFKIFKKDRNKVLNKIKEWLKSKEEYTVRFAIDMLLSYYIDDEYVKEINCILSNINREEYYINMAIAWYYSYALIKEYDKTIKIFEEKKLNKWIHNKSIQKAVESYRISLETKKYLKTLKIK